MNETRLSVKIGRSLLRNEREAVREFQMAIQQAAMEAVIFFCSSKYNLDILGAELARHFKCPLIGCTTAGELSTLGYQEGGIVGASLSTNELKIHRHMLSPLSGFSAAEAEKMASAVRANLSLVKDFDRQKMFGLVLLDGLSMLEETTITSLHTCFGNIPIVGGSAGDDLELKRTHIYDRGQFISDAAVFTVFETTLPFLSFQTQHFEPTDVKIVITGANPAKRIITEINGEPAGGEYARVLGLRLDQLNPTVFSENPLLLKIGGDWYVRSIQNLNPDESLSLFSAIDEGLVLTIGRGVDILRNFAGQMDQIKKTIPQNHFFILCDCILRKLELNHLGITGDMNRLLAGHNAIGFSTYGEQFNSLHVNQTLTGVVIGG